MQTTRYAILGVLFSPLIVLGQPIVSITTPPNYPGGEFYATVVGGDERDPTPNPCYQKSDCALYFYTISPSWLPSGQDLYWTDDSGWNTKGRVRDYPTLGDWWSNVMNKNRIGQDYLLPIYGEAACTVIAAGRNSYKHPMYSGTIVSNCARGIVQAPGCSITPLAIDIKLATQQGRDVLPQNEGPLYVTCKQKTNIIIQTNDGEKIPLGGSSNAYAVLDWGRGFGQPLRVNIKEANMAVPINLRVMTEGVATAEAGVVSGSAIVNIFYP